MFVLNIASFSFVLSFRYFIEAQLIQRLKSSQYLKSKTKLTRLLFVIAVRLWSSPVEQNLLFWLFEFTIYINIIKHTMSYIKHQTSQKLRMWHEIKVIYETPGVNYRLNILILKTSQIISYWSNAKRDKAEK